MDCAAEKLRIEKYLIAHASPVLGGIKSANLINYTVQNQRTFDSAFTELSMMLKPKGIELAVLRNNGQSRLLYVYRQKKLAAELRHKEVKCFLWEFGYVEESISQMVQHLKARIAVSECFPHEIGLFLGYPLHDVVGFLRNKGKNFKCSGCWKVYDCEAEAMRLFEKFKRCKQVYTTLFEAGKSIERLAVAV